MGTIKKDMGLVVFKMIQLDGVLVIDCDKEEGGEVGGAVCTLPHIHGINCCAANGVHNRWQACNSFHCKHCSCSKCQTVWLPYVVEDLSSLSTSKVVCNKDNVRLWPWNFSSLGSLVSNARLGLQWTLELILGLSRGFTAFYEILPLLFETFPGMKGLPFVNIKSQLWNWESSCSLLKRTGRTMLNIYSPVFI